MDEQIKILCVDDEQNVLNALKRLFIDEDYTILTAQSGPEGLAILDREHAHIILSDYRMPGMNGVEFLKEACDRWPDTVRIVLSGYADTASIVAAINEGQIYKFIPKPWNDDELKVTVSNAVERYFLHKKNLELSDELKGKNEELLRLNAELLKLLNEKSAGLEFRNSVLVTQQNIFDSIPIGVVGVDFDYVTVLCNAAWADTVGREWCAIGQSIDGRLPEGIIAFIKEVREKKKVSMKMELKGTPGTLIGSLLDQGDSQRGVILLFVREADIS